MLVLPERSPVLRPSTGSWSWPPVRRYAAERRHRVGYSRHPVGPFVAPAEIAGVLSPVYRDARCSVGYFAVDARLLKSTSDAAAR